MGQSVLSHLQYINFLDAAGLGVGSLEAEPEMERLIQRVFSGGLPEGGERGQREGAEGARQAYGLHGVGFSLVPRIAGAGIAPQHGPTLRQRAGLLYSYYGQSLGEVWAWGLHSFPGSFPLAGPRSPEKEQLRDVGRPPSQQQLGEGCAGLFREPGLRLRADLALPLSPIPSNGGEGSEAQTPRQTLNFLSSTTLD